LTFTTMPDTVRPRLIVLLLLAALVVGIAVATPGDPILSFGQPFVIYSDAYNSYCVLGGTPAAFLICDAGVRNASLAVAMIAENGTSTALVPSAPVTNLQLRTRDRDPITNATYCIPWIRSGGTYNLECNSTVPITTQGAFAIVNTVPRADGYVHIGPSEVAFLSHNTGYCSAQPSATNSGIVQCNRNTVSGWETFHIVPL